MMHRLKKIVEYIWEETTGAETYAMCALNNKEEDRSLAEAYISMATQELSHAETLISHAVRIIANADEEHISAIWEWEREKVMKRMAHVKTLIDMYRK